jgi:ribosome-associated protein
VTDSDGVEIEPGLVVPAAELTWRFGPSGGPGGQHANTAHTRAEVTFDIAGSGALNDRQRRLLLERVGARVVVTADDTRSQARNRQIALDRLAARLRAGLREPTVRRPTKPGRGARERRLADKRRRSQRKSERRRRYGRDD